ncbi:hypothetical protein KI387_036932, partial [Taxus chinensis]
VANTGGGNVAMGMYETLGKDEVMFGVVAKGMVDVISATGVTDVVVIAGIGPNCEMTGGKVEAGNMEPDGVEAK